MGADARPQRHAAAHPGPERYQPLTSLIGRERELVEVSRLLHTGRLVTLTVLAAW
jgi:hypothetical protein